MFTTTPFPLRSIATALLVLSANLAHAGDPLAESKNLLDSGNANAAYELLHPLQSELAGNLEFDYLLGIAAADSGHLNQAVFALERVLATNPEHVQARAEIARVYLALGETETSEREFQAVKTSSPPPEVISTIEKYLDTISRSKASQGTTISGYLEVTAGDDSNANGASSASNLAIPAFGGLVFTRGPGSLSQRDWFTTYTGGVRIQHTPSPDQLIYGAVNYSQRFNGQYDQFNTDSLDGQVGYSLTKGDHTYSVALQAQTFGLNNNRYRDAFGATGQWQMLLGEDSQVSAYVQYSDIFYPTSSTRDAHRVVLGGAYAKAFGGSLQPVLFLGGYGVQEEAKVREFGHDGAGVRLGGQLNLSPQAVLFASASHEYRRYRATDSLFLKTRVDNQTDLKFGLNYSLGKGLTLTPQIAYTDNQSNAKLYKFDRTQTTLTLRYDF